MPTFGFGCSLLRFIPCGLMRASRGVPSIHYFFIVIPPDCKLECGLMQTGEDHFLGRDIRRFLQCELGARSFSLHLRALNMAGFCSCFCTLLGSKIAKLVYISNSSASCQLYTTMLKWGYSWGAALRMCLKVLKHIETYWNILKRILIELPVHIWSSTSVLAAYEIGFKVEGDDRLSLSNDR